MQSSGNDMRRFEFKIQSFEKGYNTSSFNPVVVQGVITIQEVKQVLDGCLALSADIDKRITNIDYRRKKDCCYSCRSGPTRQDLYDDMQKRSETYYEKVNENYASRKIRFVMVDLLSTISLELDFITERLLNGNPGGNTALGSQPQ